jgi:hypothetical protein
VLIIDPGTPAFHCEFGSSGNIAARIALRRGPDSRAKPGKHQHRIHQPVRRASPPNNTEKRVKVFCFFFSKKKRLLPCRNARKASKRFFFEKKKQKTFIPLEFFPS